MIRFITFILTFVALPLLLHAQEHQPYILDARTIDFDKGKMLSLDGEWQFVYGEFLYLPALEKAQNIHTIPVPGIWNGQVWQGRKLKGQGIATYRLSIMLDQTYDELALKIPEQATAYSLYINDKLVAKAGIVGHSKKYTTPETKPQIVDFQLNANQLDIVFHVANFHHKKGGLWETIRLGKKDTLMAQQNRNIYYDTFLAGAILIIAFYHLGIFLLRKEDLSAFYFFLLALFSVIRVLSTGEVFILQLFPSLSWEMRLSLEHIPFYLLIGLGGMFSNTLFPNEFKRNIVLPMFIFSCSMVITNLLTPAIFHSYLILPYEFVILGNLLYLAYGMFLVHKRKRKSAWAYSLGFAIIFAAAVNDILHSNNIIDTTYLIPFGIFLFFFSQAFVLSSKSADTFQKVENLSVALQDINRNLEVKVKKRTEEIESKNIELESAYTELKRNAQQLQRNADELRKTNTDLETTKLQLEVAFKKEQTFRRELEKTLKQLKSAQAQLVQSEKMVSLGHLTAGIAHEINNPMNFIYAGVEVLQDLVQDNQELMGKYEELERANADTFQAIVTEIQRLKMAMDYDDIQADLAQVIKDITQGAERTIEIIRGLRNFSRTDNLEMNPIDIHTCIDSTLIILRNQYKNRIEIKKNYAQFLPLISCNIGQMNQVFMNLLVNAIQAIEDNGLIYITTTAIKNTFVQISIKDTGKGISEADMNKIFDPFFTTKPIGEGTGLGLSISHGIIERHHGHMEVRSIEGKGTEFIIQLPFHSAELD
ncbi:MAG: ATP-binding protein [Flammeovirgaceae bacterium]